MPAKRPSANGSATRKIGRLNKGMNVVMVGIEECHDNSEDHLRLDRLHKQIEDSPELAKRINIAVEQGAFVNQEPDEHVTDLTEGYNNNVKSTNILLVSHVPSLCPRMSTTYL